MRKLGVYMNGVKAGELTEETPGRGYTFVYEKEFIGSDNPPVSVNLPKRKEPFVSVGLFPFFSNIVPEGSNRRVICRAGGIDESDIFGLLMMMEGKDFIGAVSVRKEIE